MNSTAAEIARLIDPEVVVHRKQFVLGPEPARLVDGWRTHWINPSLCLSYCPDVRVSLVQDSDGRNAALLGLAVQTIEGGPDPADDLRQSNSRDILDRYDSWAGRWVLITDARLHPDASGLLGIFHGKTSDGALWASSSPALISRLVGCGPAEYGPPTLRHEGGLSWSPPPWTTSPKIRRLLPSQTLNFSTGQVEARRLLPAIEHERPRDESMTLLSRALTEACRRIGPMTPKIWMMLSAGSESRVVLAAAYAARLPMTAFTRISPRMSVADYLYPPELARRLGYEHVYRKPRFKRLERWQTATEHSATLVSVGDAIALVEGQRDGLPGIHFGGQAFSVGRVFGRAHMVKEWRSTREVAESVARFMVEKPGSPRLGGIEQWAQWMQQTPVPGLDWRDRFQIEQRVGGWQGSKEQLYDTQPHERFTPMNCARTFSILLSVPESHRVNIDHHHELVDRMAPLINGIPVNPSDFSFGAARALRLRMFTFESWRQPRWWFRLGRKVAGQQVRKRLRA